VEKLFQYKTHFKYCKVSLVTADNIAIYKPNHIRQRLQNNLFAWQCITANFTGRKILKTYTKMGWQYYMHLRKTGSADGEWIKPTHDRVQLQAFQNTVINSWVLQMLAI
jgi:hypothetical protein